ncbi:MAG TPA: DNA replication and repair protein RecF [Candidatus Saccharimonadales bacterium]|nr:DNA replication and repair protein RecF [Candidatus Saccharimonadales bacterium]
MITDIRLQHFRSYTDDFFDVDAGVNIIVGPNASGKTNLLEAVLVVSHGSSYKAKDQELVQFGSDWARIDAHTASGERTVKIKAGPSINKSFVINGQAITRLHHSRTLPIVLFEPNHLLLLVGSPDLRRSFLDDLIEQTEVGFGSTRHHYRRVVSQRNALLKKNPRDLHEQLFVWNVRLSELGGQIAKQRQALVRRFNERAEELYQSLAGRDNKVTLEYATRFNPESYESQLLHKLESSIEQDVLRGFTAYGPHRDDLRVLIDGHEAAETASRGETRTLVLTLKVLELKLLEELRKAKPLLLLDDVFSELDAKRRQSLTSYIADYQTFITTTDADIVAQHFEFGNVISTRL